MIENPSSTSAFHAVEFDQTSLLKFIRLLFKFYIFYIKQFTHTKKKYQQQCISILIPQQLKPTFTTKFDNVK